jgi:hypothetical protein
LINRTSTSKKYYIKATISEFLKKGGNKTFSDKNINKIMDPHRSPTVKRKKENESTKDNIKASDYSFNEVDEYIYEKQYSNELFNNDLNEINDIKPIKILTSSRNSNLSESPDEDKNSSFVSEENTNG